MMMIVNKFDVSQYRWMEGIKKPRRAAGLLKE